MKTRKSLRSVLMSGALAIALLAVASTAPAATVIFQGDNASTIQNLDVGGTLYNVVFRSDTANAVYGDPPIFDFNNEADARAANLAVAAALNTEPAVEHVSPDGWIDYLIGFGVENDLIAVTVARHFDVSWVEGSNSFSVPSDQRSYADFSVVPLPAAVWLFGSALALLGWIKRKTN